MAEFVIAHYGLDDPTPQQDARIEEVAAGFAPRLQSALRPPLRSVWHPRFGQGTVLREWREGRPKLEIDFPGVGRKLVLASYVREAPVEPPPEPRRRRPRAPRSGGRRGVAA